MRVLLVEADEHASQGILHMLRLEGFDALKTNSPSEAVNLATLYEYAAIVLGTGSPEPISKTAKSMYSSNPLLPILVLAPQGISDDERIAVLEEGADDVLSAPFLYRELAARIRAIVRRTRRSAEWRDAKIVTTGNLSVDLEQKIVRIRGKSLHVPLKEYKLLELLCINKGRCVHRERILDHLYGGLSEPDESVIRVFVRNLRRRIENENEGESYIKRGPFASYVLQDVPEPAHASIETAVA